MGMKLWKTSIPIKCLKRNSLCVYFDRQGFKGDRRWIISCLHSIITLLVNNYRFYNINTKAHAVK